MHKTVALILFAISGVLLLLVSNGSLNLIPASTVGQTCPSGVTFTITDSQTGAPIPNVLFSGNTLNTAGASVVSASSNTAGVAILSQTPPGTYTFSWIPPPPYKFGSFTTSVPPCSFGITASAQTSGPTPANSSFNLNYLIPAIPFALGLFAWFRGGEIEGEKD